MTAQINGQRSNETVATCYLLPVCAPCFPKPDPTGGSLPASGGDGSIP